MFAAYATGTQLKRRRVLSYVMPISALSVCNSSSVLKPKAVSSIDTSAPICEAGALEHPSGFLAKPFEVDVRVDEDGARWKISCDEKNVKPRADGGFGKGLNLSGEFRCAESGFSLSPDLRSPSQDKLKDLDHD